MPIDVWPVQTNVPGGHVEAVAGVSDLIVRGPPKPVRVVLGVWGLYENCGWLVTAQVAGERFFTVHSAKFGHRDNMLSDRFCKEIIITEVEPTSLEPLSLSLGGNYR
jgi:hypothetical protein